MWSEALVQYWCERYYELRDYELNPFEQLRVLNGILVLTGSKTSLAPYAETCELNWEFDKGLKKLGVDEGIFRRVYIDLKEPVTDDSKKIYKEFMFTLTSSERGDIK